jgi:chromosome segregation protein
MHLKSISLKGFKSFPERTRLEFSPGVSVIVGPNGCGKSNITDAVLWALGEQSPLAVRGQTMQDVIFAGGDGQGRRSFAEVEVVIDNSDGRAATEFSELSIRRRHERSGDGGYWLNGARCRLTDITEALADTNLGREMHSVISQGRVEEIVHSRPRERRLLIEEAAGLGKHRKRRRRAELKLRRTQDNLDRALDVEREARTRLRPLKRQARAAETHARLETESLELRAILLAEELRSQSHDLAGLEREAAAAREGRERLDSELGEVNRRRTAIEERFAERDRERTIAWGRLTALRSAHERLNVRGEALASRRAELARAPGRRPWSRSWTRSGARFARPPNHWRAPGTRVASRIGLAMSPESASAPSGRPGARVGPRRCWASAARARSSAESPMRARSWRASERLRAPSAMLATWSPPAPRRWRNG